MMNIDLETPYGFLLVDKPKGKSSYDCIRHIKRLFNKKIKIGHAGTLDPFASGLLVIALGRHATRNISRVVNADKTYVAQGKLGESTSTHDLTGQVIESVQIPELTTTDIEKVVVGFKGEYVQTPPVFSALKHKGQPLYKLARQEKKSTEEIEKILDEKKRIVTISDITLESVELPFFTIQATVSKGTYIRTLIYDIGQKLGLPATTYELRRTAIGDFHVDNAVTLDQLASVDGLIRHLQQIVE